MKIKSGHTDVASAKRQCANIIEEMESATPTNEVMIPPSAAMMIMNGEANATEKGQKSENNIEEHQGIDEETLEVTIEGDIYPSEETGNI